MEDLEDEITVFKRREIRFYEFPAAPPNVALGDSKISVLLENLELRRFVLAPVPALDEDLCTQFIKTFARKASIDGGHGIVQGRSVVLCAHSVQRLTGLPMGSSSYGKPLAAPENASMLREMFPGMKHSGENYYLPRMSRRVDNADEFIAIARMLTERLLCQTDSHKYAEAELLLGMRFSLAAGVVMPWAVFMARRMLEAVVRSKERKSVFLFGQWLSGLIRSQLESAPGNERKRKERGSSAEDDEIGVAAKGSRIKQRRYVSAGRGGGSTSDEASPREKGRRRKEFGGSEDSGSSPEKKRAVAMTSIMEQEQGATWTLSEPDRPPEKENAEFQAAIKHSPCKLEAPVKLEETPPSTLSSTLSETDKKENEEFQAALKLEAPVKLEETLGQDQAAGETTPSPNESEEFQAASPCKLEETPGRDQAAGETTPLPNENEDFQAASPCKLEETGQDQAAGEATPLPNENEEFQAASSCKLENTPPSLGEDQAAGEPDEKLGPKGCQDPVDEDEAVLSKELDKDQAAVSSSTDVVEEPRAVEIEQAEGGIEVTGNPEDETVKLEDQAVSRKSQLLCELLMLREEVLGAAELDQEFVDLEIVERHRELRESAQELVSLDEELGQLRQEVDDAKFAVELEESRRTPKECVRKIRDEYITYKKMVKEFLQEMMEGDPSCGAPPS